MRVEELVDRIQEITRRIENVLDRLREAETSIYYSEDLKYSGYWSEARMHLRMARSKIAAAKTILKNALRDIEEIESQVKDLIDQMR